jgi:hypothetical protein
VPPPGDRKSEAPSRGLLRDGPWRALSVSTSHRPGRGAGRQVPRTVLGTRGQVHGVHGRQVPGTADATRTRSTADADRHRGRGQAPRTGTAGQGSAGSWHRFCAPFLRGQHHPAGPPHATRVFFGTAGVAVLGRRAAFGTVFERPPRRHQVPGTSAPSRHQVPSTVLRGPAGVLRAPGGRAAAGTWHGPAQSCCEAQVPGTVLLSWLRSAGTWRCGAQVPGTVLLSHRPAVLAGTWHRPAVLAAEHRPEAEVPRRVRRESAPGLTGRRWSRRNWSWVFHPRGPRAG